jgi:hypothetical protein
MIKELLIAGGLVALLGGCVKTEQAEVNGYTCKRSYEGTMTYIQKGDQEIIRETWDSEEISIYYTKDMSLSEVAKAIDGCDKALNQKYQNEIRN